MFEQIANLFEQILNLFEQIINSFVHNNEKVLFRMSSPGLRTIPKQKKNPKIFWLSDCSPIGEGDTRSPNLTPSASAAPI